MSIKGLINMVKRDVDPDNTQKYLDLMETSVNKLDTFISDIIHHSRNSRMELLVKEIDFEELLNESIASLKYMEGADKVESIRTLRIKSPFFSDQSRLLIIFNNIIANAVRYRDIWKRNSFIEIDIETNSSEVLIRFSDNGIGIGQEYLDKVFKMFFRASPESKGSGLGLYIVKSVIEKLQGSIRVQSELGVGTTFLVRIPNHSNLAPSLN
jgi:signal transduction histidine kinase